MAIQGTGNQLNIREDQKDGGKAVIIIASILLIVAVTLGVLSVLHSQNVISISTSWKWIKVPIIAGIFGAGGIAFLAMGICLNRKCLPRVGSCVIVSAQHFPQ